MDVIVNAKTKTKTKTRGGKHADRGGSQEEDFQGEQNTNEILFIPFADHNSTPSMQFT